MKSMDRLKKNGKVKKNCSLAGIDFNPVSMLETSGYEGSLFSLGIYTRLIQPTALQIHRLSTLTTSVIRTRECERPGYVILPSYWKCNFGSFDAWHLYSVQYQEESGPVIASKELHISSLSLCILFSWTISYSLLSVRRGFVPIMSKKVESFCFWRESM